MLKILTRGRWTGDQVRVEPSPNTYQPTADSEAEIDRAWSDAKRRLGQRLFDGPMCRMESWSAAPQALTLRLSQTSYRLFLGTNMTDPSLPPEQRANPVGVSVALVSADGWLMLGRRSGNVAYYPHRVHPFAGSLEPADRPDVFEQALRELHEELSLARHEIGELAVLGIVQDTRLNHPELVLTARATLARDQIIARLDRHEHVACWSCQDEPHALSEAMLDGLAEFTPVALGAALLHGCERFGQPWFDSLSIRLPISETAP
jgi:hypothetical protein